MFHVKRFEFMAEFNLSEEQKRLLDRHLELVIEANKVSNLTRITDWQQGQLLHVEDSLVGLPEVEDAPDGRYADLGTGGGFPGIPLAIATGRETLLVDSVGKKTKALDLIIPELGLADRVKTYTGRAEDLANELPGEFSVITARALSSLPSLVELASPLLRRGGRLVCYKGRPEEEEVERACSLEKKLGMALVSKRDVVLSDEETHRSIIVFEKVKKQKIKLPRRVGMAQRHPLA